MSKTSKMMTPNNLKKWAKKIGARFCTDEEADQADYSYGLPTSDQSSIPMPPTKPPKNQREKCQLKGYEKGHAFHNCCCCNCKNHVRDYSHPCTDGNEVTKQRGWICLTKHEDGFYAHSDWSEHGLCEMHEKIRLLD